MEKQKKNQLNQSEEPGFTLTLQYMRVRERERECSPDAVVTTSAVVLVVLDVGG